MPSTFEHMFCVFQYSQRGSKTLGELGWIVGSSASGWIWVGMDRWMFSIWKWSGGRHLVVSDIVGPEFLCKGPPWITICLFLSASAQLWSIQYLRDHISRYNLNIFINFFFRAISLQMKGTSNLQTPGLISPIRTWNFVSAAVASGLGRTWVFKSRRISWGRRDGIFIGAARC